MLRTSVLFLLLFSVLASCQQEEKADGDYDLIVYGGTSSGVMAAYAASMKGLKVLLVEPGRHIGGLSASGLGETDIGNKYTVSGLSRSFYRNLGAHYGHFEAWRFEPHVAEQLFNDYIAKTDVKLLLDTRIRAVSKSGTTITSIAFENGNNPSRPLQSYSAKVFIDATYEGDLLVKAGVSYHIGREGNAKYGEQLNGVVELVKSNQVPDGIDPYVIPGDAGSGLIWGVSAEEMGAVGQPDGKVQAYNYRICMTTDTSNMVPIAKPEHYSPETYEVLRRIIKQRDEANWVQRIHQLYLRISPMPNQKTDINNKGGFSTDLIGNYSTEYVEASFERRKEIEQEHREYIEGLFYFLAHDPDVPQHVKEQMRQYGWTKDEFKDNGGFPHQIYVREGRRLVGDFVMTEHHVRGAETISDTIAMGAYNLDSHHSGRYVVGVMVKNEGEFQEPVLPYPISFKTLVPKAEECTNLIVSTCLSSSHVAYGSIRMEPVFMMLGQAGGFAAVEMVKEGKTIQEIDGETIEQLLKADPLADGSLPEIELNNEAPSTATEGNWEVSTKKYTDFYYLNYLATADNEGQSAQATFNHQLAEAGTYEAFFYLPGEGRGAAKPRSTSVPVTLKSGAATYEVKVDMSTNLESWVSLGQFDLSAGSFSLLVDASGIKEEVIADAVILQKK